MISNSTFYDQDSVSWSELIPFCWLFLFAQSSWPSNQFGKSYYEVWRRYSDFEWLGEMLEKHRSTLIVLVRRGGWSHELKCVP